METVALSPRYDANQNCCQGEIQANDLKMDPRYWCEENISFIFYF